MALLWPNIDLCADYALPRETIFGDRVDFALSGLANDVRCAWKVLIKFKLYQI